MQFISYVLHPLLMPTLVFTVIFYFLPESVKPIDNEAIPFLLLAILITTFIIPVLSISALRFTSTISSLSLQKREERVVPFIFIGMFYALTTYLFIHRIQVNEVIALMMITTSVLIGLLTAITLKYKISIHAAGICGSAGYLIALANTYQSEALIYPATAAIVLSGVVMTARLYLNAHTLNEVAAGCFLGFGICFSSVYFLA
ncbi:MAG: PA-phosphatase [Cyclobacteriaceae bacterium]